MKKPSRNRQAAVVGKKHTKTASRKPLRTSNLAWSDAFFSPPCMYPPKIREEEEKKKKKGGKDARKKEDNVHFVTEDNRGGPH